MRGLAVLAVLAAVGCAEQASQDIAPAPCEPSCSGRSCGPDGCGGTCGECTPGLSCGEDGRCALDCSQTCASMGLECGEHCGEVCGICPAGSGCKQGTCTCAPTCANKACGADDGCGATCSPCSRAVSCEGCTLSLQVVETTRTGERITAVDAVIRYQPAPGQPAPTIADLRLQVDGGKLFQVGLEEALLDSGKTLFQYPGSGERFKTLADGTVQVLLMSTDNPGPMLPGRWVYLRFAVGSPGEAGDRPLVVRLAAREETFAPPAADATLYGQAIGEPIVVWPVDLADEP